MKKILLLLIGALLMVACGDNTKENPRILADSSGNINNLTVILAQDLWRGEIGEAIRTNLASSVHGLPQEEPIFTLRQMPPESFSGFMRKSRIFLKIEKGQPADIKIVRDPYAEPQVGVFNSGESNEEIINLINENAERIINTLKKVELKEKQRRISKSLKEDKRLEEELGVSLKFPDAYRYAKAGDGFFWIRKDIPNGSMEILVYEVPLSTFEKDTNVVANIIKMRDSIGETYIPGPTEGTHMITEVAYAPYLSQSEVDGKFAYETKGTWEVKGAFMGGPFLNYAVRDEENNRYVVLEGFTFRPSAAKRDHMFELEAILKSADIK